MNNSKILIPIQFLLAIFLLLFYFAASATRDFHSRGEPREALVMQDMLKNSQYILPEGYGGVVPSKPPLLHWAATLFSFPSFEVTELTARLPSILAACLIAIISFYLFLKESSAVVAVLSGLILASSIEWLRAASAARVDMLLTAALMAAFFSIYRWSGNNYKDYPWLLLISTAAAMLCKGPVGIVIPSLVFVAISLVDGCPLWSIIKRSFVIFTPALILALCWYGAAYLSRPDKFLEKVYYENVARFLSIQEDEPHKASAFKLYGTLLLGFMPWTLILLINRLPKIKSFGSILNKPKWIALKLWWKTLPRIDVFSILVVVITLVFYSIPAGKRSVYILPVYPFIAFWLARFFSNEAKAPASRLFVNSALFVASLSLVLVALISIFLIAPPLLFMQRAPVSMSANIIELQQSMKLFFLSSWFAIGLVAVCSILLTTSAIAVFLRARKETGLSWFLSALFSLYFYVQFALLPAIVNPISPKVFAQQLNSSVTEQTPLLSFGEEFYGLSFYSGRRFLRAEEAGFSVGSVVVVADDDLAKLKEKIPSTLSLELIARSKGSVMSYGNHLALFKIIGSL